MPIFEYRCQPCGSEFELLIRNGEQARCPECDSTKLDKLLSAPNGHAAKGDALPVASNCPHTDAPPCGPGCSRF